jgi:hypothetical protein
VSLTTDGTFKYLSIFLAIQTLAMRVIVIPRIMDIPVVVDNGIFGATGTAVHPTVSSQCLVATNVTVIILRAIGAMEASYTCPHNMTRDRYVSYGKATSLRTESLPD